MEQSKGRTAGSVEPTRGKNQGLFHDDLHDVINYPITEEDEEELDMSAEMHKRKKKIVLKNRVFDFTSTHDILANRDQKRK